MKLLIFNTLSIKLRGECLRVFMNLSSLYSFPMKECVCTCHAELGFKKWVLGEACIVYFPESIALKVSFQLTTRAPSLKHSYVCITN